jgi:hypothetical protein
VVFATIKAEVASGTLFAALSITIARVAAAFILAMAVGSAIGYAMGLNALFDRMADPWIVVLLALPALVIIVLAYVWMGLNETAAIGAVALNKLPNAIVTIREGVRALDAGLARGLKRASRERPFGPPQAKASSSSPIFPRADRPLERRQVDPIGGEESFLPSEGCPTALSL